MADTRGSLGEIPVALTLALRAVNQATGLPCQVEKAAMPEYLLDFVPEADHPALLRYFDGVLADPNVPDVRLLAIFNSVGPSNYFQQGHEAREFFVGLQSELRKQMKRHG